MFGTFFRVGFHEHKCGDLYLLLILLQVFNIFQGGTMGNTLGICIYCLFFTGG